MCRGWRFVEPSVPGAIAPVPATPEMTQPVGIKNCRLYTLPGDATVQQFEERVETLESDVEDLDERVTDLEQGSEIGQVIGTGTIHDTVSGDQHGTFDYIITGKIATITFHCDATWLTTAVGVALQGLPAGVTFATQSCAIVNIWQTGSVQLAEARFYGTSCTVVNEQEEYYSSNIRIADGFTFTVRLI